MTNGPVCSRLVEVWNAVMRCRWMERWGSSYGLHDVAPVRPIVGNRCLDASRHLGVVRITWSGCRGTRSDRPSHDRACTGA